MFVAQELRKKSIAEYLLYMWQVEDIIRAYGCSLPVIQREYISKFDYTEEQLEEETDWFGNLITMMNGEGKRESGHLQVNEVLLRDVADLHERLLQSSKFPFYSAEYYKVLPFIVEQAERRQGGQRDRDLPGRPLWRDAAAPAPQGNHAGDPPCHQGDIHLRGHAE